MSALSLPRTVSAAVLAAAGLAVSLPGPATAQPAAMPGDRSVAVTVRNHTDLRLSLSDKDLVEGDWTKVPPKAVKRLAVAKFGSESIDDQGGTEATVTYSTLYGEVELYWRNPWSRDNEFTCDAPEELECEVVDGGLGTHPKVTFNIRDAD
ncbi:hypothetical protein [Actinoplanes sp. CA-252034]|uniref:hypothetical protein n=1 Tax=Actinoplanes sp. CA-252034 TaxID=3239906 RepID=UPI003D98D302